MPLKGRGREGNRGSLPQALSARGPPNSALRFMLLTQTSDSYYSMAPPHTSILRAPLSVFVLGPANSLGSPDYNNHTVTEFQNYASCSLSASVQTCPSFNHMGGNIWLGRKGTGNCIGSVVEYLFNKWPQNTSVVHFHALMDLELNQAALAYSWESFWWRRVSTCRAC